MSNFLQHLDPESSAVANAWANVWIYSSFVGFWRLIREIGSNFRGTCPTLKVLIAATADAATCITYWDIDLDSCLRQTELSSSSSQCMRAKQSNTSQLVNWCYWLLLFPIIEMGITLSHNVITFSKISSPQQLVCEIFPRRWIRWGEPLDEPLRFPDVTPITLCLNRVI